MFCKDTFCRKWMFIGLWGVLLICVPSVYCENSPNENSVDQKDASKDPLYSNHRLPPFENLEVKEAYQRRGSLTTGILLEFLRWPDSQETKLILEITDQVGLTREKIYQRGGFKTWVFGWPYIRFRKRALDVCESLPQNIHAILEYCSSDSIMYPERRVW